LMMAAQAEAKKEKDKVVEVEKQKTTKSFGSGFKKGFFGGSSSSSSSSGGSKDGTKKVTSSTTKATATAAPVATSTAAKPASTTSKVAVDIPTITKKANDLVLDEVQDAMKEDENPMLKQLKQGGMFLLPVLFKKCRNLTIVCLQSG
jgi:hypothetical protein